MIIVKIGGGEKINIDGITSDLARVDDKYIIVHGANFFRDKLASDLGKPKRVITSVSGYSSVYSDEAAIDIMMMAYAGLRNKKIVELCHQKGINAIGLSGVDGNLIQGKRNNGIRVKENGRVRILRDFSGKPVKINKELLEMLMNNGYAPVLTVPIIDENNFAINSENDDIVSLLQQEFHAEIIINLIEAPGLLENKDDPNTLIQELPQDRLSEMEGLVEGRMKRKLLALRKLFENGASKVVISDGRIEHPISDALNGRGTTIK